MPLNLRTSFRLLLSVLPLAPLAAQMDEQRGFVCQRPRNLPR